MKHKPVLTIGIPAYNVELYIEETVLSIAKSKHNDELEILIINDGSTDHTAEVADRLANQYSCVKVINKKNGGHGSAINSAIENASGNYFRLLDGDDWFDTEEFDNYFEKLKTEDSDIIFTDLVECFIKTKLNRPVTYYSHLPAYTKLQLDDIDFPEWGPMLPTTTIKTSLLRKFGLKIDEKCFYVDQEYNIACYLSAKTVTYLPFMVYHYRLEREGQSMEKASLIRNVTSHERVCKTLLSIYHQYLPTMTPARQQYLSRQVIIPMCHMQYLLSIEWCKSKKHFTSFDNTLRKYQSFYHHPNVAGTLTKFHRKTKGFFLKVDPIIRKFADKSNQSEHNYKRILLITAGCLLAIIIANIIVANYVNSEQTIYYWDSSAYWKESTNLMNSLGNSKSEALATVTNSLNTDYNLLPVIPMVPFLAIFGTSRLAFVLIILNLYVVPFAFFMTKAIKALFNKQNHHLRAWLYPIVFSVFLLSPSVLIPVINGRPDAICIFIISLIFYLLAKTKLKYISNYFTLGILTFLLIILRRYFCFWAISLYIAIFITKAIINLRKYGINKTFLSKTIKVLVKLFLSGLLILLIMALFFRHLLVRYLTGGYNDAYSAYMIGDFFNQILLFIRYYGVLFLTLSTAGIAIAYIKYRKTNINEFVTIGLLSSIISFLLFTRVQTLGDQHMYMFVPFFTACIAILTVKISSISKIRYLAVFPIIVIISLSILSFTGTRTLECSNACYIIGISETVRPSVRNDLDSLKLLSQDLNEKMTAKDYVYIISSSHTFNDDILRNLNLPSLPKYNISGVKHVDKRDGFPFYFFDASYVVIADPVQTHLPDGQEVISYLANQILSGKATNLQLVNTYQIDNNITLNLYHKQSAYTNDFLKNTKQYFQSKYPNYPFLYDTIQDTDPLTFQN